MKILTLIIIGMFLAIGIVVADYIITNSRGEDVYVYEYILPRDAKCDIHWLRPNIFYYIGFYPDFITYAHPDLQVGFNFTLSKDQKIQLDNMIGNYTLYCNQPKDFKYQFKIEINPSLFVERFATITNVKPFYYSDGINVYLYTKQPLTSLEINNLRSNLCQMWTDTSVIAS